MRCHPTDKRTVRPVGTIETGSIYEVRYQATKPRPLGIDQAGALYDLFLQKGARIFSFYEVNRPIENGYFFGSEVPQVGSVSQMEATIPDAEVTATVANGHPIGLYANSFIVNCLIEIIEISHRPCLL